MTLVLATIVCLGTLIAGAPPWTWTLAYRDGLQSVYSTSEPKLCLEPRPGRAFTYTVCSQGDCVGPTSEIVASPFPGDANFDCAVGGPDQILVGQHFGEACP